MTGTHPKALCRNCGRPAADHGTGDNPHRSFACPGPGTFPKWPSTVRDEKRAGELFDRRVAKYWTRRTTAFAERV